MYVSVGNAGILSMVWAQEGGNLISTIPTGVCVCVYVCVYVCVCVCVCQNIKDMCPFHLQEK